jgi:hypothetical protein
MDRHTIYGIVSAAVIAAIAGIVLWYFYNKTLPEPYESVGDPTFELKTYESIETEAGAGEDLKEGFSLYTNGRLNFKVQYPSFYIPNEVKETAISTSVLFSPAGGGTGAQIYVVYYPKDKIDDEQFKLDVPSGVRENVSKGQLGGIEAVVFESMHTGLGKTYEIWAIHNNYLYELTVPLTDKKILDTMAETWQFLR